jgi:hypothetical protein|nr:MAG TPA: tail protein [Caudoviricetes sp.]
MMTYTTKQGDMWDGIAKEQLGDEKHTDLIMAENPAYLLVYIFSDGIVLNIPEVNDYTAADELPPWKVANG